jgi:uncharacterized membrane protein YraQ (UPF0718 family)
MNLLSLFQDILSACWEILLDAAPFILLGFFVAGLVKALLPEELVVRHLGGSGSGSVFKAALFGIPLPLCSCGVIPAAIGLKKQGAGKGATSAFLISTPETGVDSIAVTYALLDPLMTLFRPLAAFVTAVTAGLLENLLPGSDSAQVPSTACAGPSCCGGPEKTFVRPPLRERLRGGLTYAFGELLGDIGKWLLIGIGVAGVISALIPDGFIERHLSGGLIPMLVMLVAGIPLYVCASASTPIAAALVLKGLSPGAALVFLLAGPATNSATITAVARYLGRRSLAIYLAAIAGCSLLLGLLLDAIYGAAGLSLVAVIGQGKESLPGWLSLGSAVTLLLLLGFQYRPRKRSSCEGEGCGCR